MEAPRRGTVLGDRYELEDLLGRGGMADVYRAKDQMLERFVAVKLLRTVSADERDRARFAAEARTLAQLNHPGLVTVLDAGASEDHPYLVMQLIDGPSLSDRIKNGPLEAEEVARIGSQVAEALSAVHDSGVVHRDVKPANVLLDGHGRAWLTDFGIARLLDDAARHTATGMMIGSPAYLSPEQLRGEDVTSETDVYSLGLVLLEALTAERAYPGSGVEAAMARLSSPPHVPDWVPEGWRRLLEAMTAREPAHRPTTRQTAQLLSELRTGDDSGTRMLTTMAPPAAAATASQTAVQDGPSTVSEPPQTQDSDARKGAAVVAVLVAVVVIGLGAWLITTFTGGPGTDIPSGVPSELQQPLRDLHEAVEGDRP